MNVLLDVRHSLRSLARSPGYVLAAALTLGVGLGANTAIFSVLDALLLRPLPYPDAGRIVLASESNAAKGWNRFGVSAPAFHDLARASCFSHAAAFAFSGANVSGGSTPDRVRLASVAGDPLATLGLLPALGRSFTAEEAVRGKDAVVVISDGYWRRAFAGDPGVLNRTLLLDGIPYTIVGVAPPALATPFDGIQILKPLPLDLDDRRGARWLEVVARVKPGLALGAARAETTALWARLARDEAATNAGWTIDLQTLRESVAEGMRPTVLLLFGAVLLLLAIACANAAHLSLVRAIALRPEIAIRAALGGSRPALFSRVVSESVLVALAGGLVGLVLAFVSRRGLERLIGGDMPLPVGLDLRVLAFSALLSLFTGLLAGIWPARVAIRSIDGALRAEGRSLAGGPSRRTRRLLTQAELALAVILLAAFGLVVRSVSVLLRTDAGFRPDGALTLRVAPPQIKPAPGQPAPEFMKSFAADRERTSIFYSELEERLARIPGATAAGAVNRLPLTGSWWIMDASAPGGIADAPKGRIDVFGRVVTPGYFGAIGIPLREGRAFAGTDRAGSAPVVAVSESLARRIWPGESALGKELVFDNAGPHPRTVVAVVGDVRAASLETGSRLTAYVPFAQAVFGLYPDWGMDVVVRSRGAPLALVPSVREAVRHLRPDLPVFSIDSLAGVLHASLGRRRTLLGLLGVFAGAALLLAALGTYALIAYTTRQRTRELGIRMALGATASDIQRLVLGEEGRAAAAGIGVGLVAALAATRLLRGVLYGVSSADPAALFAAAALLAAVAVTAGYFPARRAGRLSPAVALRDE